MDPHDIHSILYYWSTAQNPSELASRVLGSEPTSALKSNKITKEISQKIQDFLKKNVDQFFYFDLSALENLKGMVTQFTNLSKELPDQGGTLGSKGQKNFTRLERAISDAIRITQNNLPESLPESLQEIVNGYLSLKDCLNLALIGHSPTSQTITAVIDSAIYPDFYEFGKALYKESDLSKFKIMINIFFANASLKAQANFFLVVFGDDSKKDLQRNVLIALPRDLTCLNIYGMPRTLKMGMCKILHEFTHLERMSFSDIDLELIEIISDNPNSLHLKDISLRCENTQGKEVLRVLTSEYLVNLKSLTLRHRSLNCESLWGLLHFPFVSLPNLQNLNLSHCGPQGLILPKFATTSSMPNLSNVNLSSNGLFDKEVSFILEDPYIKLESLDLSDNNRLSDEVVNVIIKNMTDLDSECAYRSTLQNVNLDHCPDITNDAKERLEVLLQENRNRAQFL